MGHRTQLEPDAWVRSNSRRQGMLPQHLGALSVIEPLSLHSARGDNRQHSVDDCRELLPVYALVTPTRNEAQYIQSTIRSVLAQTILPIKWVIVSDGSTDGTDDIVRRYAAMHSWIEFIRMPDRGSRHFAGKALAFQTGYDRLKDLSFAMIGNVDADISFEPDYFEFLLRKLVQDCRLGLVGTPFREGSFQYNYRFTGIEHVSGPCQLFRRECFEDIGGYVPRQIGGIDLVAVLSARMKGWHTRTFLEKTYIHHRKMGSANGNRWANAFEAGKKDYLLGGHPLWEVCRYFYLMSRSPIVAGGILRCAGFLWLMALGAEPQVPRNVIAFRRTEQMCRMRTIASGLVMIPLRAIRRVWRHCAFQQA